MSRRPGYETLDYIGYGYESRRETMMATDIGRPRGIAARRAELAGQADVTGLEQMRMRLRLLELQAP